MFVASSRSPSQSLKGFTPCTWSELVARELVGEHRADNTYKIDSLGLEPAVEGNRESGEHAA